MLSSLLLFCFITRSCWLYQAAGRAQQQRGRLGAIVSAALVTAVYQPSTRASTGVPTSSAVNPHITSWKLTGSNSLLAWTILIGPCSLQTGGISPRGCILSGGALTMTWGLMSCWSPLDHSLPIQLRLPGLEYDQPHGWGHSHVGTCPRKPWFPRTQELEQWPQPQHEH